MRPLLRTKLLKSNSSNKIVLYLQSNIFNCVYLGIGTYLDYFMTAVGAKAVRHVLGMK